ncbi:hypothetical protein SAMN05216255_1604 [Pseudomonas segetis]|uniref:Uncharacterized protein n=1 Tax=Pseudomonas segetis TaxID=298908 RepID=A0A239CCW0_9PSED|nr:hypothetical protein SAMN05216255_1604 [Pseudomonas segetis]
MLTSIQLLLQELSKHLGIVVAGVFGGVKQGQSAALGNVEQRHPVLGMIIELLPIALSKRAKTLRVMGKIPAQPETWCKRLQPLVKCQGILAHAARPYPINQNPLAVADLYLVVHPLTLNHQATLVVDRWHR